MNHQRLIIYAKCPIPGYAKTRLAADLGDEAAAGVYARLLYRYLLDLVQPLLQGVDIEIAVSRPSEEDFFRAAFPECWVRSQVAGDLGTRMMASFRQAFTDGCQRVILTGSDIPGLTRTIITHAFEQLQDQPGVIGPAMDGGYYLVGLQTPGADLFTEMAWSTAQVLADTETRAIALGIPLTRLPPLMDIDTLGDYLTWAEGMDC